MIDYEVIMYFQKSGWMLFAFQSKLGWFLKLPLLHSKTADFALQNCQFCIAKVAVLRSRMVRFAFQNGAFCKTTRGECIFPPYERATFPVFL